MQRWTLILLLAIGILIAAPLGVSVTHADYPVDRNLSAHEYLAKLGYFWVFGDPHSHSTLSDGKEKASVLLELATKKQGFCFLTDHAEQLSADEIKALGVLAASFQRTGTLAGVGFEWTGTPDYLNPKGEYTKDPAEITGPGHMLVYDSEIVVRQMAKSGDPPANLIPTFPEFLGWVGRAPGMPLVAFAHPSLYRIEETFDQNGDGRGFDPVPTHADERIVDQTFGCELSSHSFRTKTVRLPYPAPLAVDVKVEGYRGLGNGKDLRSSNEAGYRELLRGGWRISPLMSTDWHLPGYKAGPYTGVAVRERSINGVLDGFYERLTCGTEVYGVSLAMTVWQRINEELPPPHYTRVVDQPIVRMGQTITLDQRSDMLMSRVSAADREGRPVRVKEISVIEVHQSSKRDRVFTIHAKDLPNSRGDLSFKLNVYDDSHEHITASQDIICWYATATVPGVAKDEQLICAPVYARYAR